MGEPDPTAEVAEATQAHDDAEASQEDNGSAGDAATDEDRAADAPASDEQASGDSVGAEPATPEDG